MNEPEVSISFTLETNKASLLLALYLALVAEEADDHQLTRTYTFDHLVPALLVLKARLSHVMEDWTDADFSMRGIDKYDRGFLKSFVALVAESPPDEEE